MHYRQYLLRHRFETGDVFGLGSEPLARQALALERDFRRAVPLQSPYEDSSEVQSLLKFRLTGPTALLRLLPRHSAQTIEPQNHQLIRSAVRGVRQKSCRG